MKLALELANLCSFNGLQDIDQQSCISDQFIGNGHTLAQLNDELKAKKSQNMTECVPVPSSEHVAEIVGRQGKLTTFISIKVKRFQVNTQSDLKSRFRKIRSNCSLKSSLLVKNASLHKVNRTSFLFKSLLDL